jgi:hypothetical protein
MLHPHTRLSYISDEVGFGVVATRRIPAGTLTWVLDPLDRTFSDAEVVALPPIYHPVMERYSFVFSDGMRVLCWDLARFVNHSCEPNCVSPTDHLEFAIRDIEPGEQLTNDYATLNLTWKLEACRCGAPTCRGTVGAVDLASRAAELDQRLDKVRHLIEAVEQPLMEVVAPQQRWWLRNTARGGFPSVTTLAASRALAQ